MAGRYRIGIDVGGTNTDAVILDERLEVVASVKRPTTADTGDGVAAAIDAVLAASGVDAALIGHAMLGTTHCTNAIVERRGLGRVGILRLGAPATTAVPPLEGWPDDLRAAIGEHVHLLAGGFEVDGRVLSPVDEEAVRAACRKMRGEVDAVAVVGVFSPIDESQEERVATVVVEELGVPVSRSARIGSLGLLERENATVLNAALMQTLRQMAAGFVAALRDRGIPATPYFGQNDGTLMQLEYALEFPVLTIGCGPTNSIRGAAHLSGATDALVVDIGGTTTDIGVLVDGFPRQSAHAVEIGGIRTNFRMPDVLSVGLGGGTIIRETPAGATVGPDSVGYRLPQEGLAFGGSTLTATDVALAVGGAAIDGIDAPVVPATVGAAAWSAMRAILEDSIDRMKPNAAPVPVILVGGGGIIAPTVLDGVAELIRPDHFGAANAVGAALGEVAGQIEKIYRVDSADQRASRADAAAEATERARLAGADPATIEVVAVEELPVAYSDGTAVLIRARAVGRLAA
ncbi:hydantoinase/oxoprolinase family protein [Microbacterium oxydans]|uniref:Acetophenone carboxylase gamma subunit n=4 Tax=Microbacterium TaxID=33882 RepID=A0A147DZZ0_9MICO|nr:MULTISPECIES: hydantoinase/oxoprolinase family protein [Microbacterium]AZS39132.1 Acetophenone carboxylase gamma subunit [Microbacterium oxydans]KTR76522.1 hydantoinase subunit beta [Microbacterium oxydans]MBE7955805.1 hydantoinase/oxoprolinase family protein [Microbacterium sp. R1]NYF29459.1 N-methylhydantoinase A/oxoprolinase/acetone carboxylase beta subunit [Microbacterium sp. JAI119]